MSNGVTIMHSHFELVNGPQVTTASQQHPTHAENQKQSQGSDSDSEKFSVIPDVCKNPSSWRDQNRSSFIVVCIGLCVMYTAFELDNTTLDLYIPYATSSFKQHAQLATVYVVWSVVYSVAKPPIAKLSDIIGRETAYFMCIVSYCLAYIILSTAHNMKIFIGGFVFYAIGQSGVQVLNVILISELTTERWRAFWLAVAYFPYLVTCFVSANIAGAVVNNSNWRWGIGMFGFIMPCCSSLLIVTLFLRKRQLKASDASEKQKSLTALQQFYAFVVAIDLGGILLLSGGAALILVPCSLAASDHSTWSNPAIEVALGVGAAALSAFPVYEYYVGENALVPLKFFKDSTIVISCALTFLDSCAWGLVVTYLFSWIVVTQGWSTKNAGYYLYTHGLTMTISGMIAGVVMGKTRRYKYLLLFAIACRMIGYGLMFRFRKAPESVGLLVMTQVVSGFGSGVVLQVTQVASQIVVEKKYLASVTSVVLLFSFLGNATGQSIAGGMWATGLPRLLAKNMPDLTAQEIADIVGSITDLPAYGTPGRAGIAAAYIAMMRRLVICALSFAAPSFILIWFMNNTYLKDSHNDVEVDGPRGI